MTHSGFQDDADAVVCGRANGYAPAGEGFRRADSPDEVVGDGGLLTTLVDLARWHGFLSDGRVLGERIRDRLLTRAVLADGRVLPYAHGIVHEVVAGRPAVGHGGALEGYRAQLLHLTDDGSGVAVLANRSDADVAAIARKAVAVLSGAGTPARSRRPAPRAAKMAPGLWFSPREQTFLSATQEGARLILELGRARVPFTPAGPGEWRPESLGADITVRVDGHRLELAVGEDDWNATWYDRVKPQPDVATEGLPGTYLSHELGALATVAARHGELLLTVGATGPEPLQPVRDDLFRTPTHTLACERTDGQVSALLFSGARMRRVRFQPTPVAAARGFPVSLGGPVPPDPERGTATA